MMSYMSSSLPLIFFIKLTLIKIFLAAWIYQKSHAKWADKLRLEMTKLASFTKNFECVTALSPLLGNGKHFPFLYVKRTLVIPLDITGYCIEISTDIAALLCLRPRLSKGLTGFLLLHNNY